MPNLTKIENKRLQTKQKIGNKRKIGAYTLEGKYDWIRVS
jgi:hypothetical protein